VRRLIAKDVPPFPASALARTSPVLKSICAKATRGDRDERFATALEMKEALDAWLAVEDPRGSIAELAALLKKEIGPSTIELPSTDLVTRVSIAKVIPKRRGRVAIASVGLAVATLVAALAWPKTEGPAAPAQRPSPRVETPMLVKLDPTTRPVAPPPEPPKIEVDRFDPGY